MKTLNKLKLISLFTFVIIGLGNLNAQCNYNVFAVDSLNPPGIDFFSNTTGTTYFWDFGDGNTSTQQFPTHIYASPGTYYYCLSIDSCPPVCDSVQVTVNNPCNINAGFNFTDNGGGNFIFTSTATGNISNHYWNFGDGNTSTQINPSHTYATNGSFPVQQIVYDSSNNCIDMTVLTITVTGVSNPVSCNAAFVVIPDSNSSNVTVLNTSTGNNLSYFWDFGDGNTSTLAYPSYTYTTPGPFWLCLTVTGGNCTSTYCDSINSGGTVLKQTGFTVNVQAHTGTGLNENVNIISELNTYPNPVKNQLTIELNLTQQTNLNITITDVLGNIIDVIDDSNLPSGTNKLYWNTNKVSNGIYLLQINGENTNEVKKLIINK